MSPDASMPIRAVLFDAYGTLLRGEGLTLVPQQIVGDHGLTVSAEDVQREWIALYSEAIQEASFRTLREIQSAILPLVLRRFDVAAAATPYVDLFFQVTTRPKLYDETLEVLSALRPVRSAVVSNADHEHLATWTFTLPVEFILISEAVRAYKPHRRLFEAAVERLGLRADEVLHVGDSELDDVKGAKDAGLRVAWLNRSGRSRRPGVPAPDFEIRDLTEVLKLLRPA